MLRVCFFCWGSTNLHYCLEVECCAVPEREFAAVRPGEEPSTFRRPFDDIDGMASLIQGRMEVFCWNGINRIVWFRDGREHL